MFTLWNKNQEKDFFVKSLDFAKPEQVFYLTRDKKYYAYWPKGYTGAKTTLQSRNSLIGSYTEKWNADLFNTVSEKIGGYSVQGVVSEEIGLTRQSPADVAICKTKEVVQEPENILMILETKMSVVWNWEFVSKSKTDYELICIGDYKTHQGNPGLLRLDTI